MKRVALVRMVILLSLCITSCAKTPPPNEEQDKFMKECIEDDQPHKGIDFLGIPLGISAGRFIKMNRDKVFSMNDYHPYSEAYATMRITPEKDLEGAAAFIFTTDKDAYRLCSVYIDGIDPASSKDPSLPVVQHTMTAEMRNRWVAYFKAKLGDPVSTNKSLKWKKDGTTLEVTEDNHIYLDDQALVAIQDKYRAHPVQCF